MKGIKIAAIIVFAAAMTARAGSITVITNTFAG